MNKLSQHPYSTSLSQEFLCAKVEVYFEEINSSVDADLFLNDIPDLKAQLLKNGFLNLKLNHQVVATPNGRKLLIELCGDKKIPPFVSHVIKIAKDESERRKKIIKEDQEYINLIYSGIQSLKEKALRYQLSVFKCKREINELIEKNQDSSDLEKKKNSYESEISSIKALLKEAKEELSVKIEQKKDSTYE